jgi:hypothetical protein
MNAIALIAEARAAGLSLNIGDGGRLKWTSAHPPPGDLLARLHENKGVLIQALEAIGHRGDRGHRVGDAERDRWRYLFEERAGIREFDGGLSRAEAEREALGDLVSMWRSENPLPASGPSACFHCGGQKPDIAVLAAAGHTWLHVECLGLMNESRQREAERAARALLGLPLRALSTRVYDRTGYAYKTTKRRAARPESVRK